MLAQPHSKVASLSHCPQAHREACVSNQHPYLHLTSTHSNGLHATGSIREIVTTVLDRASQVLSKGPFFTSFLWESVRKKPVFGANLGCRFYIPGSSSQIRPAAKLYCTCRGNRPPPPPNPTSASWCSISRCRCGQTKNAPYALRELCNLRAFIKILTVTT